MALVEIDVVDYLDEVSDRAILREFKDRMARGKFKQSDISSLDDIEIWTPEALVHDLREAFYRRNASEMERLLTILGEITHAR